MTRPYQYWTPQLDEEFTALVHQGVPNVEIARLLGRTASSVGNHKRKLGLIVRALTCPQCGRPIEHQRTGHPRTHCSDTCLRTTERENDAAISRAAAEARKGRICAGPDCSKPLPTTNARQRFCSRLCSARVREQTYNRPRKGPA